MSPLVTACPLSRSCWRPSGCSWSHLSPPRAVGVPECPQGVPTCCWGCWAGGDLSRWPWWVDVPACPQGPWQWWWGVGVDSLPL